MSSLTLVAKYLIPPVQNHLVMSMFHCGQFRILLLLLTRADVSLGSLVPHGEQVAFTLASVPAGPPGLGSQPPSAGSPGRCPQPFCGPLPMGHSHCKFFVPASILVDPRASWGRLRTPRCFLVPCGGQRILWPLDPLLWLF